MLLVIDTTASFEWFPGVWFQVQEMLEAKKDLEGEWLIAKVFEKFGKYGQADDQEPTGNLRTAPYSHHGTRVRKVAGPSYFRAVIEANGCSGARTNKLQG